MINKYSKFSEKVAVAVAHMIIPLNSETERYVYKKIRHGVERIISDLDSELLDCKLREWPSSHYEIMLCFPKDMPILRTQIKILIEETLTEITEYPKSEVNAHKVKVTFGDLDHD